MIQTLDGIQMENQRLQNIVKENNQQPTTHLLDIPGDKDNTDALSISSNDIEIESENYVNIDYQKDQEDTSKVDGIDKNREQFDIPMSEQLKILREALDETKNDVTNLREEKLKFEKLSENLNLELNSLKSELQNQSVFELSQNKSFQQHYNQNRSSFRILEASVHELLTASGYQLPLPEDDEAEPLVTVGERGDDGMTIMDESMLPSQYLHEGEADSDDDDDGMFFFFLRFYYLFF